MTTLVSIVTYNSVATIESCIYSLSGMRHEGNLHVMIEDNSPDLVTCNLIHRIIEGGSFGFKIDVRRSGHNLGWGSGNNANIKNYIETSGGLPDIVMLVNPDTSVQGDAHEKLVGALARNPKAGLVGGLLSDEQGRVAPGFFPFHSLGDLAFDLLLVRRARKFLLDRRLRGKGPCAVKAYPSGSFVGIRGELLDTVGFMDDNYFLYFDDEDYALRALHEGYDILFEPEFRAGHIGGVSSRTLASSQAEADRRVRDIANHSMVYFYRKWFGGKAMLPLGFDNIVNRRLRNYFS